jgi:hypothetical protein
MNKDLDVISAKDWFFLASVKAASGSFMAPGISGRPRRIGGCSTCDIVESFGLANILELIGLPTMGLPFEGEERLESKRRNLVIVFTVQGPGPL